MSDLESPEFVPVPEVEMNGFEHKPPFLEEVYDEAKWEKWEQGTLKHLEDEGYITRRESGEIEADVDKLRNFQYRNFRDSFSTNEHGISPNEFKQLGNSTEAMFVRLFGDREVFVAGEDGKRPLLYMPEDEESAFNVEAIRSSEAAMGLWEIGKMQKWQDATIPTKSGGFKSDVPMVEAAVPFIIYNKANGRRSEDGKVYVDKVLGKPELGRQPISGGWFRENALFRGASVARFDSPSQIIEQHGLNWEKYGLLSIEDFPIHNRDKEKYRVAGQGNVTIGNRIYGLGTKFAGAEVRKVAPAVYVASSIKEGVPDLVFSSEFDPRMVTMTRVDRGDKADVRRIYIPREAILSPNDGDKISVVKYSYGEGKRLRTSVSVAEAINEVRRFASDHPSEIVQKIDQLSLEHQVAIITMLQETEGESFLDYLNIAQDAALVLIADAYLEGGSHGRVLEMRHLGADKLNQSAENYLSMKESGQNFISKISGRLSNEDRFVILRERIRQAWIYRSSEFVSLATTEHGDEVEEYLATLNEAFGFANELLDHKINYKLNEAPDPKSNAISGNYQLGNGSTITITARNNPTEAAQSRIQFNYRNASGRAARVSLDFDEYGLSLDLASRRLPVYQALQAEGVSYHTQQQFEKALAYDRESFQQLAAQIPEILGWRSTFVPN